MPGALSSRPAGRHPYDISGTWSPPAANVRLRDFRNIAITSYNGTPWHGPWPAEKHLAALVITVRTIPSHPSDSCRTFRVLLKEPADRPCVSAARQKRAALMCLISPRIYGSRLNGMESLCPDGRSVWPNRS